MAVAMSREPSAPAKSAPQPSGASLRDAPASERYTRFERAKIIGARALQVSLGAPVLLDIPDTDPLEIAIQEFGAGVIPITVRRHS